MGYTILQARYDIAAAHRLGARMGLNEGFNGGHFSLMVPGRNDLLLTVANGTHWEEACPDNVITVDMKGNTVEGAGQIERSAFHIHSALHRARPDLRCLQLLGGTVAVLGDNRIDRRVHVNASRIRIDAELLQLLEVGAPLNDLIGFLKCRERV